MFFNHNVLSQLFFKYLILTHHISKNVLEICDITFEY